MLEFISGDKTLLQYWLGTYIHFMAGVLGTVFISGVRGFLAVGPRWGTPILAITGAILTRFIASVNRGIVAQEFGGGNFIFLIARFLKTFATNTFTRRRYMDFASLCLLVLAASLVVRSAAKLFTEFCDEDGDGCLTTNEVKAFAKGFKDDIYNDLGGK